MPIVDIVFLVLLFVVQPIHGHYAWKRLLEAIEAGEDPRRIRLYALTALVQWVALAVMLAWWATAQRPWAWLGIHAEAGRGFYAVLALGAVAMVLMAWSAVRVRRMDRAERHRHRGAFGDLAHFLPQTDGELKAFFGLSVTAGVVEELLFRGFALWALSQWMPLWAAVVVSSVAFGLGHSYQGPGGMLRTGAVGFVFALLFLGSGSIWLPIVFHALFDIVQGVQIREIFRDRPVLAPQRVAG